MSFPAVLYAWHKVNSPLGFIQTKRVWFGAGVRLKTPLKNTERDGIIIGEISEIFL